MKIAFIGQKGIPAKIGGIERHVEETAVRMAQLGHSVFVYVRNNYTDKNIKEYKGVKLIHLPSVSTKNLDAITHTFLCTLHALFQPYDVVHYHAIGPTSLAWIIKAFKRKTALVSTFHCQDYHHQKWGRFAKLYLKFGEKITCTVPDRTITVSKVLSQYVKNKYGTYAVYIPNGANVTLDYGTNYLNQWNLEPQKYILAVTRLIRHKGLHFLIEAFKKIVEENNLREKYKLVIVGEGFHTDNYVKEIKEMTKNRDDIVFTGPQNGAALHQLFTNATLFVQPSLSEGLSISLLEAMGYGLPVLVSDIAENVEAVGNSGVAFEQGNSDDLAIKMKNLLNDPEKLAQISKEVKSRVESIYSWDAATSQILQTYESVIYEKKSAYADKAAKIWK